MKSENIHILLIAVFLFACKTKQNLCNTEHHILTGPRYFINKRIFQMRNSVHHPAIHLENCNNVAVLRIRLLLESAAAV